MTSPFSPQNDLLVPFDKPFSLKKCDSIHKKIDKDKNKKSLKKSVKNISELQRVLYADDKYSLLCIFQAMDAAGKDSTIRAVFSGVNPAGLQVFNFKKPSSEELEHDFLWRSAKRLPERGRIGVFNRSYYEEVLIVRVHEGILQNSRIPKELISKNIWKERYKSINDHEEHLARNGTVILKFFLNVSKDEQKKRFLSRLDEPEKNWKFETGDVRERGYWDDYMEAYQEMLQSTSKPHAPWYVIPADDKPAMRAEVANIIEDTLSKLPIDYPIVAKETKKIFNELRNELLNEE